SIFPLASRTIGNGPSRPSFIAPVTVQNPPAGSYNSALVINALLILLPPATSTIPLLSNTDPAPTRGVFMKPVWLQLSPTGSYNSEKPLTVTPLVRPPATSTWP